MNQIDINRRGPQADGRGDRHAGAAPMPAATHDMLILNSRPDLTPDFPAALAHPSPQRAQVYPAPARYRP